MARTLDFGATSVHRTSLSSPEPNDEAVHECDQPEQHVGQVDPNSILHATLALLFGGRMVLDVDATEEAEKSSPEDADHDVSLRNLKPQHIVYSQKAEIPCP